MSSRICVLWTWGGHVAFAMQRTHSRIACLPVRQLRGAGRRSTKTKAAGEQVHAVAASGANGLPDRHVPKEHLGGGRGEVVSINAEAERSGPVTVQVHHEHPPSPLGQSHRYVDGRRFIFKHYGGEDCVWFYSVALLV